MVLRFNPALQGAHWEGKIPSVPPWSVGLATVQAVFWFDEAVPFTRESWRGRMPACRGVGATLAPAEVAAFDTEAMPCWSNWRRRTSTCCTGSMRTCTGRF
jgi:hypothetical protein